MHPFCRRLLLLSACIPTSVLAAETQQPPQAVGVEEVVVTAQRREERLQDVPISISSMTGEGLKRSGISDTRQLTQVMPSLVFSRANTTYQPYIRGVGTRNAAVADESMVSVYVDGVYQVSSSSIGFDLANIERIEVLRGPQGTLFGRNATGGLINIITPAPSTTFGGKVTLRAGSFGERSFQSYVTGPLSDSLRADLTLIAYNDDGYIKDFARGGKTGERRTRGARSKLLYEPNDRFSVTLIGNYFDVRDASSVINQPWKGNTAALQAPPFPPVIPSRPWEAAQDWKFEAGYLNKTLDLLTRNSFDNFNIETTSSVQATLADSMNDNDGTTKLMQGNYIPIDAKYRTHEIRILSTGQERYTWITGAYYLRGWGKMNPVNTYTNGAFASRIWTDQNIESISAFVDGTFAITDKLKVLGGVRYSDEKRNYRAFTATSFVVPTQYAKFDKVTYRASVQYKFADESNIYASYSRGFKSGVFNSFATTLEAAKPVRPETLDAMEVGIKAQPTYWLRTNLSAFHYDYKDVQQSAKGITTLTVLTNAASAKIDGLELEVTAQPSRELTVRGYATYLDAKFDKFPQASIFVPRPDNHGNISVTPYDASGKRMIRAPKFTVGGSINYAKEYSQGTVDFAVNAFHSSKVYLDPADRLYQPAYTLVNGEVGFSLASDNSIRIAAWGRNLTNEVVYSQLLSGALGDIVSFDRPRSYGVSVTKTW